MRVRPLCLHLSASFLAGAIATALLFGRPVELSAPGFAQASYAAVPGSFRYGPYPAEVLRVIDGDTLEARVRVWPGQEVVTKVRLRGVDAPELRGRCASERALAERARHRLFKLVTSGPVVLSGIGPDKYFGRVVADLALANGGDAGAALLAERLARRYAGRTRAGWCEGSPP